ncbi:MAG: ATP-binding protein, partial [Gammaproteobacteria bacterium]|nr:ATP-binding protein [Gammaproteobacteria bacterium]
MSKIFNTTGPCNPDEHYMLPAQARCRDLLKLIEQKHYFVIRAARQSGKTTLLLDLARQLNDSGDYHALYCSPESVQKIDDAEKGIPAVIRELSSQILFQKARYAHRQPHGTPERKQGATGGGAGDSGRQQRL